MLTAQRQKANVNQKISMDMRPILVTIIATLALLLAGCTSMSAKKQSVADDNDPAAIQLAEAASSVSESLANLSAIERATTPLTMYKVLPNPDAYGMSGAVSVDWSGPVAPLVQKIATISGYQFRALGVPPAIPVIVTISAKDTPLAYVLRDADFQCGKKASILVYPGTRVIELRYARS